MKPLTDDREPQTVEMTNSRHLIMPENLAYALDAGLLTKYLKKVANYG
jgi:hypothetical protein